MKILFIYMLNTHECARVCIYIHMCMCVYAYVNIICISCIWEDFSTCRNIKIEVILVLNFSLSANNKHEIIEEKKMKTIVNLQEKREKKN